MYCYFMINYTNWYKIYVSYGIPVKSLPISNYFALCRVKIFFCLFYDKYLKYIYNSINEMDIFNLCSTHNANARYQN